MRLVQPDAVGVRRNPCTLTSAACGASAIFAARQPWCAASPASRSFGPRNAFDSTARVARSARRAGHLVQQPGCTPRPRRSARGRPENRVLSLSDDDGRATARWRCRGPAATPNTGMTERLPGPRAGSGRRAGGPGGPAGRRAGRPPACGEDLGHQEGTADGISSGRTGVEHAGPGASVGRHEGAGNGAAGEP